MDANAAQIINNSASSIDTKIAEEIYKRNVELLDQRRRAEELLYGIAEGVLAVDTGLRITLFNNTLEKMLRLRKEEAIGKQIEDIITLTTEDGKSVDIKKYCLSENPEFTHLEGVILTSKFRSYFVNLKSSIISPITGETEGLITLVDITKEKELEKTKDDFISITSHELRTPMTIIKSYLWMLAAEKAGTLNDKQREYVSKATRGTERMLALINDMLNIARIEQGKIEIKPEPLKLIQFIEDLAGDFRMKMQEKNLTLNIEYDQNATDVFADKTRLMEIFINLIGNSFKFTDKGSINIKTEKLPENYVKIYITDTGKGIDKKDMERLFHKFGRLDNSYQTVAESGGTGLGLYIVKLYIEKMNGMIGLYSKGLGYGTTFWFTLPTVNTL